MNFDDALDEFQNRLTARLRGAVTTIEGDPFAEYAMEKKMDDKELLDAHEHAQAPLINPAHQVYFRAGLIACREYMARFVEGKDPSVAQSIRANWWPQLGEDPGPPRLLNWNEVADGGEDGPWKQKEVSPSVEALPLAELFLKA